MCRVKLEVGCIPPMYGPVPSSNGLEQMVSVPPGSGPSPSPPKGGSGQSRGPCNHLFRYLETRKHQESNGSTGTWTKIDRFYCEKCLEIKVIKQKEDSRERPDWY